MGREYHGMIFIERDDKLAATMRPPSRLVFVLPIALTLASLPRRRPVRVPTHVACVGDSITYGYMASSVQRLLSLGPPEHVR